MHSTTSSIEFLTSCQRQKRKILPLHLILKWNILFLLVQESIKILGRGGRQYFSCSSNIYAFVLVLPSSLLSNWWRAVRISRISLSDIAKVMFLHMRRVSVLQLKFFLWSESEYMYECVRWSQIHYLCVNGKVVTLCMRNVRGLTPCT